MSGIHLSTIDLNLLRSLDALLRHVSVTAAARDVGITQPAMSRTLTRLRAVLGDPILVRVGRGLVATERARGLVGPVGEALRAAENVFAPGEAFDPATARGEVQVAMGDEAQLALADAIVRSIWSEAPGIDVRLRPLSLASLDEGRRGILDLAISPDLSALPAIAGAADLSDFVVKPLYTRRFVVVSSRRFPRRRISLKQYVNASHVIVGFDGGGRGFVDELLAARGLVRRVSATVTSFVSAAALVSHTELLATIPEEVVRTAQPDLVACAVPFDLPTIPVMAVWHPRRTPDVRHRWLRDRVMRAVIARASLWKGRWPR